MDSKSNYTDCEVTLNELDASQYSVLLGNGILMANSTLQEMFPSDFLYGCYQSTLKNIEQEYESVLPKVKCPELFLNILRIEFSCEVLKSYDAIYSKFKSAPEYKKISYGPKYLRIFKNIFTLNYDPLTYQMMFLKNKPKWYREFFNTKDIKFFADGIFQKNESKVTEIEKNIETYGKGNGLYFLHGAFHLYRHSISEEPYEKYAKVTVERGKSLTNALNKLVLHSFRNSILESGKPIEYDLTTVIESRPQNKLIWIERDPYLNFCLERLTQQEKILTLGCSFSNDDHLLEKLMLSDKLQELKIGVFSKNDVENIHDALGRIRRLHSIYNSKDKLDRLKDNYEKISFVCTQKLGKIFWDQNVSTQCNKLDLTLNNFDEL